MSKQYPVPEKLALFFDRYLAMDELKEKAIKSPFGFRRAKKCAIDATTFRRKFWNGVFEIYPELKDNTKVSYIHEKAVCIIDNEDNEETSP